MPASETEAVARGHSSDKSSEYEDILDDYVYVCNQSFFHPLIPISKRAKDWYVLIDVCFGKQFSSLC